MRLVALVLSLLVFWLLLSGHYTMWLVSAGVLAAVGISLFGRVVGYADDEGHPVERLVGAVTYWPWLLKEIVKSGWDVAKIVVNPRLPISPTMLRVPVSARTPVGITTYANSGSSAEPMFLQVSGVTRQYKLNAFVPPPTQRSNSATGWGVSVDVLIPVIPAVCVRVRIVAIAITAGSRSVAIRIPPRRAPGSGSPGAAPGRGGSACRPPPA